MLATTRAMVVLPVPGGPVKIMCFDACAASSPAPRAPHRHLRRRPVALDLLLDPGEADLAVEFCLGFGQQRLTTRIVGLCAGRIPRVASRRDLLGRRRLQPVGRILQRGSNFRCRM